MLHQCSEHIVLLAQFVDIKWSCTGLREGDLKSQWFLEEAGRSFLPQVCRQRQHQAPFFSFNVKWSALLKRIFLKCLVQHTPNYK